MPKNLGQSSIAHRQKGKAREHSGREKTPVERCREKEQTCCAGFGRKQRNKGRIRAQPAPTPLRSRKKLGEGENFLRMFGHLKMPQYVCVGQTVFGNDRLPPPLVPLLSARLRKVPPSGAPCAICFLRLRLRVSNRFWLDTCNCWGYKAGFDATRRMRPGA